MTTADSALHDSVAALEARIERIEKRARAVSGPGVRTGVSDDAARGAGTRFRAVTTGLRPIA